MARHQIGDKAIMWTNANLIHLSIYAALGGDELNHMCGTIWSLWPQKENIVLSLELIVLMTAIYLT